MLLDRVWVRHRHLIHLNCIATLNRVCCRLLLLGVIGPKLLTGSCVVLTCGSFVSWGCWSIISPCMALGLSHDELLLMMFDAIVLILILRRLITVVFGVGMTFRRRWLFHIINWSSLLFNRWNSLFFVDFWWNLFGQFGLSGEDWTLLWRVLIRHQHSIFIVAVWDEWVRFSLAEDIIHRVKSRWALEANRTVLLPVHIKLKLLYEHLIRHIREYRSANFTLVRVCCNSHLCDHLPSHQCIAWILLEHW